MIFFEAPELLSLFLERGMDPAIPNGNGETAVAMVRSQQLRREQPRAERGALETPEQQAACREYNEESDRLPEVLEGART